MLKIFSICPARGFARAQRAFHAFRGKNLSIPRFPPRDFFSPSSPKVCSLLTPSLSSFFSISNEEERMQQRRAPALMELQNQREREE